VVVREPPGFSWKRRCALSETPTTQLVERVDHEELTTVRVKVPMLTTEVAEDLFGQITPFVEEAGRARLILNLAEVEFISSTGIGKLITLMHKTWDAGGRLAICNLHPRVAEVLRTARLTDILIPYDDEQEARQAFR
jgi:anti-sigma B factor antagonist